MSDLNIKNHEATRNIREMAALAGEGLTEAIIKAVDARLEQLRAQSETSAHKLKKLNDIALHCAALPVLNDMSEDDILGYDENGLPV